MVSGPCFLFVCLLVFFLIEFHSLDIVALDEEADKRVKSRIRALNMEPVGQLCCLTVR